MPLKNKKEYQKEYRLNNKEKINEAAKQYRLNNKEKINEAGKQYRLNNKEKTKAAGKRYRLNNKEKIKEKYLENKNKESFIKTRHQYYLNNREHIKRKTNDWRLNNKKHLNTRARKWRVENRELANQRKRAYYKKNSARIIIQNYRWGTLNYSAFRKTVNLNRKRKRLNDPNFRIAANLRGRIHNVLKGVSKSDNTMKLVGCTIAELWKHLESKFEPWMTRENYGIGGWDLDHIKACAKFDLTDPEQQRECFNWSNLQPMEHIENIKKGTA